MLFTVNYVRYIYSLNNKVNQCLLQQQTMSLLESDVMIVILSLAELTDHCRFLGSGIAYMGRNVRQVQGVKTSMSKKA